MKITRRAQVEENGIVSVSTKSWQFYSLLNRTIYALWKCSLQIDLLLPASAAPPLPSLPKSPPQFTTDVYVSGL